MHAFTIIALSAYFREAGPGVASLLVGERPVFYSCGLHSACGREANFNVIVGSVV
jgi:hypothetical protein